MKKFNLIVCIFAIVFTSCKEDKLVDVTVLPEQTQTGKGTFGCLVDGNIYVGGRYADHYNGFEKDHESINFIYSATAKTMNVIVKVKPDDKNDGYIKFTIDSLENNVTSQTCRFTNARFGLHFDDNKGGDLQLDSIGTVKITRMDYSGKIISGVFYGKRVTEGRFDVIFK